jgi:hypothetical protein
MIKKQHYSLILIILGSVALNFLNSPVNEIFFDDKEIFKYVGLVIYKGGVPYRDVFDHKPPLIYFLNAFNWWFDAWMPWLMDTCLVLFATLLFYWLCRKNRLARPWILPLLFNLLIRYSLISFGNGMTREYTGTFLLIFFCVMQGNARYKFFILGMLVALTGWMQQDALLTLAPFLIYSIFISEKPTKNELGKRIISMASGFVVICLPVIIYFSNHQSFKWLWKDAFLFNLNAPGSRPGIISQFKTIKHTIHEAEFEMAFYTALILGLASLLLKNKSRTLTYMALLTLVFSFAGEFLSGRLASGPGFIYYLLPLAATIPIMLYVVFTEAPISFLQDKTAQLILSIIAGTTILFGTIRYAAGFHWSAGKDTLFAKDPEIEYLKSIPLSDYELFVFDDSNLIYLYNYHKILCPTPWIYHYFWSWDKNFDPDYKVLLSIFRDLQTHSTRFILDCSTARNDIKNKKVYGLWQQFLQSHYVPVMKYPSNRVLWRIQ